MPDDDAPVAAAAEAQVRRPRRGIYLLPNLFTTAALFAGFYSIVAAMNSDFERAAIAIFVAMVLDGLDGRIARMTNTQSDFGAQYDSLADVVSFGLAPALVSYEWMLSDLGRLGWLAAFFYAACCALRLARFNTQLGTADKRFFQGLPSPAAAALVAGFVWAATESGFDGEWVVWASLTCCIAGGALMVSNVRFNSFKDVDLRGKVPFIFIFVALLGLLLAASDPPRVLFIATLVYVLSGCLLTLVNIRKRRRERRRTGAPS